MVEKVYVPLNRRVLSVAGDDRRTFLQGLVSNDVLGVSAGQARWAAMLTPQGKFLWDIFIIESDDTLLLDVEADRFDAFAKKLSLYKLRSKVVITPRPDLSVVAILGEGEVAGLIAADPRLPVLGRRAWLADPSSLAAAGFAPADFAVWDALRLQYGVPDGSRDMVVEQSLLLESGFEELHGVDFDKGCYMGQELTARTKYRGLVKKRLLPVSIDGPAPSAGDIITCNGADAGDMRSSLGQQGLALVRLDYVGQPLTCGQATLTVRIPDWVVLPTG